VRIDIALKKGGRVRTRDEANAATRSMRESQAIRKDGDGTASHRAVDGRRDS